MSAEQKFPADMTMAEVEAELARCKGIDMADEPCGLQDAMADYVHALKTRRVALGGTYSGKPVAGLQRKYSETQLAPAAQTVAQKVAFGLRHAGLHTARAEGPRAVTISRNQLEPWMTTAAVRSLVEAAAKIQRVDFTMWDHPGEWTVSLEAAY
jgi:hypothetical protein